MQASMLEWNWRGVDICVGSEARGTGPKLLLLPALSSISTRQEMRELQQRLAASYATMCADWPGFGDAARPQVDWTPAAYSAFLSFLLTAVMPRPYAIIAAGHGATYALELAPIAPQAKLVLLAPTWRGPLPTVLGGQRPFFERLCHLVDLPVVGPLLYRLNVNRLVLRHMAVGHVYSDPAFLNGSRLREKLAVTRAPGARFASVRFVTGRLDPIADRGVFLDLARRGRGRRWKRWPRCRAFAASSLSVASLRCTRSFPTPPPRSSRRSCASNRRMARTSAEFAERSEKTRLSAKWILSLL
jgi:hypothetical protein